MTVDYDQLEVTSDADICVDTIEVEETADALASVRYEDTQGSPDSQLVRLHDSLTMNTS